MSMNNENAKTPKPLSQEDFDTLSEGLWKSFHEAGRSSGGENRQAVALTAMAIMELQNYKPQ